MNGPSSLPSGVPPFDHPLDPWDSQIVNPPNQGMQWVLYRGREDQHRTPDTEIFRFDQEEEAWKIFIALIKAENAGKERCNRFTIYCSEEYESGDSIRCRNSRKELFPIRTVTQYLNPNPHEYYDIYQKRIYPLRRFEHVRVRKSDGAWIMLFQEPAINRFG